MNQQLENNSSAAPSVPRPSRRRPKRSVITVLLPLVLACISVMNLLLSRFMPDTRLSLLLIVPCLVALVLFLVFIDGERRREAADSQERDRLRVSEEEYRIAAQQSGKVIYRYDIVNRTARYAVADRTLPYAPLTENLPDSVIEAGHVAEDSIADFKAFFRSMQEGVPYGSMTFHLQSPDGGFLWSHSDYTLITGESGNPLYAIVSYYDVTEQREKEIAYEKWRQSVESLPVEQVALFEYNLTRDTLEHTRGALLHVAGVGGLPPFAEWAESFVSNSVHPDEAEACHRFLNRGRMLTAFHQGERTGDMEFRLIRDGLEPAWLRLSIQMVEYPDSSDVKVYLMFEDVDQEKRRQLELKARSEEDSLTKALNREAFQEKTSQILRAGGHETQHAFLIVDLDNFKSVNDALGHSAGDRTLTEIAGGIRAMLRQGDLFGRLGGDEFIICLVNIPYDAVIEKRARQICALIRRMVDGEVEISASIGVAVFPRDGDTFQELYKNADAALYYVKEHSKNGFTFYSADMAGSSSPQENELGLPSGERSAGEATTRGSARKRAMLVACDSSEDRAWLSAMFTDEYRIIEASGGAKALSAIQRHGTGIAVVLLSAKMADMDALEVLARLRINRGLASIPVIVTGGPEQPDFSLRALELGAADCLTGSLEPDVLRLRVQAVITKSENDRLRIQNSYLLLQSEEEERYRNVIRSTGTVVFEYDWINRVFKYDPLASQYLWGGYDDRSLWRILLADGVADTDQVREMQRFTFRAMNDASFQHDRITVRLKSAEGAVRYFRMSVLRLSDEFQPSGKLLITLNDIHEEVLSEQKLRQLAERDPVTGLFNRAAFMEKVQTLIRTGAPGSYVMLYFDVDRFKIINDRYGHAAGDELLRFIAERLAANIGGDGLCCRISADFFAACTSHDEKKTALLTDLLRWRTDPAVEVTGCFGLYVIDDPTMPVDAILDRAALAHASAKGNYLYRHAYYDESLRGRLLAQQEIEGQMNTALESGQFDIYLQPQYSLITDGVVGAEALVRWLHPQRGVIGPGEFVPIFERNGFIRKLDAFVWERTCRLLRSWLDRGRILPVSVNISRVDLDDPALVQKLFALVKRYNVPVSLLKLEITESAYAENPRQLIDVVEQLQAKGFSVEMDDFGSGYSSLNTLKDVPVNTLKLDLRFLSGEDQTGRGGSIINSVIRMAKWLRLPVVAEGVETRQQAEYLKSIGCDYAQGYLYAKPMPVEAFERLLNKGARIEATDLPYTLGMPDANAFWNPDSLQTLIFNSYVGGAAILEYGNGQLEILRVNDKYRSLLGLDKQTLENLRFSPLLMMPEEERSAYQNAVEQAMESGQETECVTRRILSGPASEDALFLRTRLQLIAKSARRTILYAAVEDVTAENRATRRLQESQQMLFSAARHARLYYWTYDLERDRAVQGQLSQEDMHIPETMENYPESLLATDFIHPDFVDCYRQLHTDLKNGAREVSADVRSLFRGEYEWRKVRYSVIEERDGLPTKAIGTSESLSAYKLLEKRFLAAAKQSGILTWTYDLITKHAHQEFIGQRGEAIARDWPDVPESTIAKGDVHPEDVAAFRDMYARLAVGAGSAQCTIRLQEIRNGQPEWRWKRLSCTMNNDKDGDTNQAIGTVVDVSDEIIMRKRFTEAMQRFDGLDRHQYVSLGKANLTRRQCTSPSGPTDYEAGVLQNAKNVTDPDQRRFFIGMLNALRLQNQFIEGLSRSEFSYRLRFPDGLSRWVNTVIRLHLDPDTQELFALFYTTNIHDSKMEQQVFQSVVHMGFDFVTAVDALDTRYKMISTDQEDWYRPSESGDAFDLAVKSYAERVVHPEDRSLYQRMLNIPLLLEQLDKEGAFTFRYRSLRRDGTVRQNNMSVFFIDQETKRICIASASQT